jgi:hypothetical protein
MVGHGAYCRVVIIRCIIKFKLIMFNLTEVG